MGAAEFDDRSPMRNPEERSAPDATRTGGGGAHPDDVNGPRCDLCGAAMLELHCKLTCAACGYMRDCSDP